MFTGQQWVATYTNLVTLAKQKEAVPSLSPLSRPGTAKK